ncbi:hypothetical protein MFLAVUS_003405 [Mucor flavus]|uniref:Osmotin, thaumatin-like protein n=1 Tax=Mucor flavus TaxID=439312 RepID=A0ABP9YT34_9FUNG
MLLKSIVALLTVGLVAAAPASNSSTAGSPSYDTTYAAGPPTVIVKNQCSKKLTVGHSVDVDYYGETTDVAPGDSVTLTIPMNWSGRVWGRENCSGKEDCFKSGMTSPASLAEFHFMDSGKVFYDISFVNGFNLPIVVEPVNKIDLKYGDASLCRTSTCTNLPTCPTEFQTFDDEGNFAGCKSACTYFQTDEYCCTGDYYSSEACSTYSYASDVKAACPDVYSYAFDDVNSAFMCTSNAYTVTFC